MAYCPRCGCEINSKGECMCTMIDPLEEERIRAEQEAARRAAEKEKADRKAQKRAEREERKNGRADMNAAAGMNNIPPNPDRPVRSDVPTRPDRPEMMARPDRADMNRLPERNGRPAKPPLDENDPEVILARKSSPKAKLIKACIILAVFLFIILFFYWLIFAETYKTPIKKLVKGINKEDASYIVEATCNDVSAGVMHYRAKSLDFKWDDYLEITSGFIKSAKDKAKIEDVSVDFLAKQELAGSDLKKVEDFYFETYGIEVKEAYKVEVNFTIERKNGVEIDRDTWLVVANLKNGGWKFCYECSDITAEDLEFIDEAMRFK